MPPTILEVLFTPHLQPDDDDAVVPVPAETNDKQTRSGLGQLLVQLRFHFFFQLITI